MGEEAGHQLRHEIALRLVGDELDLDASDRQRLLSNIVLMGMGEPLYNFEAVRDAMKIAMGAGVMLVVAAAIEAFWSPAPIDHSIKYIVGIGSWVFVYVWLIFSGRGDAP